MLLKSFCRHLPTIAGKSRVVIAHHQLSFQCYIFLHLAVPSTSLNTGMHTYIFYIHVVITSSISIMTQQNQHTIHSSDSYQIKRNVCQSCIEAQIVLSCYPVFMCSINKCISSEVPTFQQFLPHQQVAEESDTWLEIQRDTLHIIFKSYLYV